jgi:signal transduction histidine kinase
MFETYNLSEVTQQVQSQLIDQIDFTLKKKKDRKKVLKKFAKIVDKYQIRNVNGSVNRAIGNAVRHGQFPVNVHVLVGHNSKTLVIVKDQGQGFDYYSMLTKFSAGKKYFDHHGRGTITYSENEHSKVCWHDGGRTISVLFN